MASLSSTSILSQLAAVGTPIADFRMKNQARHHARGLAESEYRSKLARAGFEAVSLEPTRIYRVEDAQDLLSSKGVDEAAIAPLVNGKFISAFIRARKPKA